MPSIPSLELLLRLNQIPNVGSGVILRLLKQLSIEELLGYGRVELASLGWSSQQIQRWLQPKREYIDPVVVWHHQSAVNQVVTILMTIILIY